MKLFKEKPVPEKVCISGKCPHVFGKWSLHREYHGYMICWIIQVRRCHKCGEREFKELYHDKNEV